MSLLRFSGNRLKGPRNTFNVKSVPTRSTYWSLDHAGHDAGRGRVSGGVLAEAGARERIAESTDPLASLHVTPLSLSRTPRGWEVRRL